MRSFLIGFFAGLVLSALRAPLGLELLQVPATSAGAAMAYRAAALLVVGVGLILGLRSAHERFSSTLMLVGTGVGYQLHWQLMDSPGPYVAQVILSVLMVTLLVAGHSGSGDTRPNKGRIVVLLLAALIGWYLINQGFPKAHGDAVLVGIAGLLALAIVGRSTGKVPEAPQQDAEAPRASGNLTGLALCGAGLALLLEGLARHLRLMGGGLAADDSVFGTVLFTFMIFGAFAFGRPFLASRRRPLVLAGFAALSGLAAWGSLRVIANLATRRGLEVYLLNAPLEVDRSLHGTLHYDMLIAAPVLILPAFALGTVIALVRRPIELAALLIGSGAGLACAPRLLQFQWSSVELLQESNSVELVLLGGVVAAVGALLTVLTSAELTRKESTLGSIIALGGIALCVFPSRQAIRVLSPWEKREPQPLAVHEIPEGLLTVELDSNGTPFATLNRRALTAPDNEAPIDTHRIQQAWKMLGESAEDTHPTVLFVGQLDIARALCLVDLGADRIDRCAPWSDAMPMLEHHLFGGEPSWFPGEILSLGGARQHLERGDYDLVIVAPIAGQAPTTRNLASPPDTTVVVWLDAGLGLEQEHLGKNILLSAPHLTALYAAVVHGPQVEAVQLAGGRGAPAFVDPGEPTSGVPALLTLTTRKEQRGDLRRRRFCERIALAERSPGMGTALAAHFGAQARSSPFLTDAQSVELDPEANTLFSAAATAAEPDALVIEVIESLADLLGKQRKVEEIDRVLRAPAERHRPWPALEIALAQAALEFLEPEEAVMHLASAHEAFAGSAGSLAMQAEALAQVGDDTAAVRSLDLALALVPHNVELERRLAIALRRSGDARGVQALREALELNPENTGLLAHQGSGPYPAPPAGYHPVGLESAEHDH